MSLFDRFAPRIARLIASAGDTVTIYHDTGTTTNEYNSHVSDWTEVGTTAGVRYWGSLGNYPEVRRTTGGRYNVHQPQLVVPTTELMKEGARVSVRGDTYRVDSTAEFPGYVHAQLTGVTEYE